MRKDDVLGFHHRGSFERRVLDGDPDVPLFQREQVKIPLAGSPDDRVQAILQIIPGQFAAFLKELPFGQLLDRGGIFRTRDALGEVLADLRAARFVERLPAFDVGAFGHEEPGVVTVAVDVQLEEDLARFGIAERDHRVVLPERDPALVRREIATVLLQQGTDIADQSPSGHIGQRKRFRGFRPVRTFGHPTPPDGPGRPAGTGIRSLGPWRRRSS